MQPNYAAPQMMPQQPQQMGNPQMNDYMARMQQQLNEYNNRAQQQMQQLQAMQNPQASQQPMAQPATPTPNMVFVANIEAAQNYPPDLTGNILWLTDGERVFSKRFNVKAGGVEFHKYKIDDSDEPEAHEIAPGDAEHSGEGNDVPDKLNAIDDKIKALEEYIAKVEEELKNAVSGSSTDDTKPNQSGSEPKAANRQRATAKPRSEK